jgi:hypothetical protein
MAIGRQFGSIIKNLRSSPDGVVRPGYAEPLSEAELVRPRNEAKSLARPGMPSERIEANSLRHILGTETPADPLNGRNQLLFKN